MSQDDETALARLLASFGSKGRVGTVVVRAGEPGEDLVCAFLDPAGRVLQFSEAVEGLGEPAQEAGGPQPYPDALRAFTAHLISVQEAENRRLARELHDSLGQRLAAIGMELSALSQNPVPADESLAKRLKEVGEQFGELAADVHMMSRRLHPAILDDLGLAVALEHECDSFTQLHGIPVEFTAQGMPERLEGEVALSLYRIAQESLQNIRKHAGSAKVRVVLGGSKEEVVLSIDDTGRGFTPEEVRGRGGLGMVSMEERARLVGGSLSVQSEPGIGTRVQVRVPLRSRG